MSSLAELRRIYDDPRLWLARELRRRGWSQRQLGYRTGVDHSTISRLVNGKHQPTFETILLILEAFEWEARR